MYIRFKEMLIYSEGMIRKNRYLLYQALKTDKPTELVEKRLSDTIEVFYPTYILKKNRTNS